MNEMLDKVIEKLEKEIAEAKVGGKEKVIIEPTKKALIDFCRQESEFAQAILESDKSLSECCAQIVKGVNTGISDFEVYRKAVQFYFPGADICFEMRIDLCASVRDGEIKKNLKVSLMDLM